MSSDNVAFLRASVFSGGAQAEGKNALKSKPSDKEDKRVSLSGSALPTGDNLPAALRALGTSGLKATVPVCSENGSMVTSMTKQLGSAASMRAAYLTLRGVPEGMQQANTQEEEYENFLLILALANAVLAFEKEPEKYTPSKVPNTLAHARKLLATQREQEEREERERKAEELRSQREKNDKERQRLEAEAHKEEQERAHKEEQEELAKQLAARGNSLPTTNGNGTAKKGAKK